MIDAALSGTVSYKVKSQPLVEMSTLEHPVSEGRMFKIHEDTAEDEEGNLLDHSTCTLSISDDESQQAAKDDRGKENIPPLDFSDPLTRLVAAIARPVSRQGMITGGPCSPLADLDARDYWVEGAALP